MTNNYKLKKYIYYSLILFFCCEAYLRFIKSGFNVQPINPSSYVHHEHPKNFRFRSYHPSREWGDFLVSFDSYGNRDIKKICKKDTQFKSNMIFLGDSFTESIQVSDSDSFSGLVQNEFCERQIKISNLGVTSYSPVLSYIQLKKQLKENKKIKFKGSTIIHLLSENDAIDDKKYFKNIQYNKNSKNNPFIDSNKKLSIIKYLSRNSYNFRFIRRIVLTIKFLFEDNIQKINLPKKDIFFTSSDQCPLENKDLEITSQFVNKIFLLAKNNGARYILSAVPDDPKRKENTNYSCYKMVALNSGIEFIDAPEELFKNPSIYYFEKDLHLNILGNKILANKIIKFLNLDNFNK